MSRARYIRERLQAKKRKMILMRGGITVATLCAAMFFLFMPKATSGTGGLAERETPKEPIEVPQKQIKTPNIENQPSAVADSMVKKEGSKTEPEPIEPLEDGQIAATKSVPEAQAARSNTPQDVEEGRRSPERQSNQTNQTESNKPSVQFDSPEAVLGTPATQPAEKPAVALPTYMKMPDYKNATLKYQLGLISSDAYSPSEKEQLHQYITNQFASPNAQVEAVYLEAGGQKFTKSYPIRLYLLRLEQNPSIRIRSLQEVKEGGRLSGLIVKE